MTNPIHIYFNEQYPHGYTTALKMKEAFEVQMILDTETKKHWWVTDGAKHWKTGKPCYYTISCDGKPLE